MVKKNRGRERVRRKLGFFLSLAMIMQITGSLIPCKYAYAEENQELPFKNVSVSLLKNGQIYDSEKDSFSKNDDVSIKYEFDIPSDTAITQETKYRLKIPEQFKIKSAEFNFDEEALESIDTDDENKSPETKLQNVSKVTDDTESSKNNNVDEPLGAADPNESKVTDGAEPSKNNNVDESLGEADPNESKVTEGAESSKNNNVDEPSNEADSNKSKVTDNTEPSKNIDVNEPSGKTDSGDSKAIEEQQKTGDKLNNISGDSVNNENSTDTVKEQEKSNDIINSSSENSNDESQDKGSIDSSSGNSSNQKEVTKKLLAGPVKKIPYNFGSITINEDNSITISADELAAGKKIHGSLLVNSSFNPDKIGDTNPETVTFYVNSSEKCKVNVNFTENEGVKNNLNAGEGSISASNFIKGVYLSTDKYDNSNIDNVMCPLNKDFIKHNKDTYGTLSDIDIAETLYVCYLFKIPSEIPIKSGDQVKIKIPEEFMSPVRTDKLMCIAEAEDETKELEIGKIEYTSDHDVIITFNDNIESKEYDLKGADGFFWFGRGLDKDKLNGSTTKTIDFKIDTEIKNTYTINFKEDEPEKIEPSIEKKGEYIPKDQEILWTITVKAGSEDIVNYILYDDISEYKDKHTFIKDSLKCENPDGDESIVEMTDTLLIYNLGTIKAGEKKIITYKTRPSDSILKSQGVKNTINNTVQLKDSSGPDGKTIAEKEASVDVKNDFIIKNGRYNSSTRSIDWTININKNKVELEDVSIEDSIADITSNKTEFSGSDLTLKPETIKVIRDSDGLDVTKEAGDIDGSNESIFKYTFKEKINDSYTIKFSTRISDSAIERMVKYKDKIYFYNKVTLKTRNDFNFTYKTNGIGIGRVTDIIKKEAESYDKETKEVTWKITINSIKVPIKDAKITEKISKNQEIVEGSVIGSYKNEKKILAPALENTDENGTKEYSIDIGDITDVYIVRLKTKIIDDSIIWANESLKDSNVENKCVFFGDGAATVDAQGKIPINSKVIEKNGSYNYSDRTLTWTVILNKSNTPLENAEFIDEIEKGQKYVENSFSIKKINGDYDKYSKDKNADVNEESEVSKALPEYTPNDADDLYKGGKLVFTFPKAMTIKNTYEIKYKTQISDEYFSLDENGNAKNSNFKVHNKGELHIIDGTTPRQFYAEKDVEIKNYMIDKNFQYTKNNDFISWEIYVNRNKVALKDVSIVDKIAEGLQVDMNSVKLYEVHFNEHGDIDSSKTTEVNNSEYSASYNADTRELEIKYAKDEADTNTYMIKFDTDVDKPGTYSNSVKFNSIAQKEYTDDSGEVCVIWEDSGSGSLVSLGRIKIKKEDKEGHPLAGAQFELIRVKNGIEESVAVSAETGIDGIVQFRRLSIEDGRNSYIIREIKAPEGYYKAADQSVTLTSENKIADIVFQDEKIPSEQKNPEDTDHSGGTDDSGGSSSSGGSHHHHHHSSDDDDDDDDNVDEPQINDDNISPDEPHDNPIDNNSQDTQNNTESNPNIIIPMDNSGNKPNSTGSVDTENKNTPQDKPSNGKNSNRKNKKVKLPQAGRMFDTKVVIGLGIILIAVGLIIMTKRKHMKKNNCK